MSTSAPAAWTWRTARTCSTGGAPGALLVDRDEHEGTPFAPHRRLEIVPVRVLPGDLAVERLQPVKGGRHGQHLRRPVDLHPLAHERVVQHAQGGAWVAAQVLGLGPILGHADGDAVVV